MLVNFVRLTVDNEPTESAIPISSIHEITGSRMPSISWVKYQAADGVRSMKVVGTVTDLIATVNKTERG